MHFPAARKANHAHVRPRQGVVPVGPAVMPPAHQDTSFSVYFTTGGAVTVSANPSIMTTATALVIDTNVAETPALPSQLPRTTLSASSSSLNAKVTDVPIAAVTNTASTSATATAAHITAIDPFQEVYTGMTLKTLHSLPPWVVIGAIGGAVFMVLLALYCVICRWYYKRLPRNTKRWDIDSSKEVVYGDNPRYSPSEKGSPIAEDDRRGVAVGDSYFPQGETWRKFEGRTARHPESFIYTGTQLQDEPGAYSPTSPPISIAGTPPSPIAGLARPRPRFANPPRHRQADSVFSNVSFPTTHRADSIRESNFFPDGFEHDGEIWDLASLGPGSPGFASGEARPSLDSTARSVSVNRASLNRRSLFGDAAARARGSIVVYDSQPQPLRSPVLDADPFAGPAERGNVFLLSSEKFGGKKSMDGGRRSFEAGKKSMDGKHAHTRSRDVRALGTLVEDEDADEPFYGRDGKTPPTLRG